jgi:ankyrin repeat protein
MSGANPNQKDHEGTTPLQRAAFHGRVDCALLLLSAGATINDRYAYYCH